MSADRLKGFQQNAERRVATSRGYGSGGGNPYHDKRGEFSSKGNAVSAIGSPADAHTGITAQTARIAVSNVTHRKAVARAQASPAARSRNRDSLETSLHFRAKEPI